VQELATLQTATEPTSLWQQPSTYLIFGAGIVITLLGMGIYYWIRIKKSKIPKNS
jgi:hypothetical protein